MKRTLNLLLLTFLLVVSNLTFSGVLDDAWKAFNENDRTSGRILFKKALSNPTDKPEAYIGLAIMDYKDGKVESAYQNFVSFFEISNDPYPYLYALWSSGVLISMQQKLPAEKIEFMNKILKDPRANGTIKAMISGQLGYDAIAKNNIEKSADFFAAIKSIDQWQLVGEFDNISGSGFDKDYPPVSESSNKIEFENKVKAKVKWFTLPMPRNDKWVDFAYCFNFSNSIIFAQSFVKSPIEQDVYLRLGVSGAMKVWINDALVGAESEDRNTDLDVYTYKTHLAKGNNRILIQIGESDANQANFLLRLTDEKGIPLEGLTVSAEPQPYTKQTSIKTESIPLFSETYFENKITQNPRSILNYYMLSEVYLRNDKVYEARKVLFKARELAPNSTYISRKLMEAFMRDGNETDQSKEWENLKKIDPDNIMSLQSLYSEAEQKEDIDEMEKIVNKMEKLYGRDEKIIAYKMQIAALREKTEDIVKLGEEGYKNYPDVLAFVETKSAIENEINKNLKGAISVYEKFLKNNYSEEAKTNLSSLYFKNGSPDKGIKIYEQILKVKPYAVGYMDDLTEYFTEVKEYDKAIRYAEQALQYTPYIGSYWANLGKVYYAMNDDTKAIENLKKATYYSPNDYDTKKLLRKLLDKKDLYEYFEKADINKIINGPVTVPVTQDDNAVVLHDEIQKIIYAEGGSEEKEIIVTKILSKSGVDNWKEYQISYNSYSQRLIVEEAKITKPNGSKSEAERNGSYLVFTGLEVGDIVTIIYRLENYNYGTLASEFWEKHNLNGFYPRQHVKVSYIIPKNKKFNYKTSNFNAEPKKSTIENIYDLYVWELKDEPSLISERFMPPLTDVGKYVHISSIPDWNYIAGVYADMSTTKAKANYEVKELVNTLFKDKKGISETEKAKIIYEWILENIHYSYVPFRQSGLVPQKASTTINTKLGDCKDLSTLFVSMAKEVGLKANLVLINTHNNGEKDLRLPSLDFNHCIAKVTADGKLYYLELTYPQLSFGSQTSGNIGALSLNIPNEPSTVINNLEVLKKPNSVRNDVYRETEIKFDNNDITINRKNIHYGAFAASRREDYQEKSKDEKEKAVQQTVSKAFNKPVKLNFTEWDDLNALNDSTVCTYNFTVKGGLNEIGGMKLFEIPWMDAEITPSFLSTDKRNYNINFWQYDYVDKMTEVIKIKIPDGKSLIEVPKSQTFNYKNTSYSLDYKVLNNQLIAQRKVVYGEKVIPNESYEEFKEFFNKIIQEDHKQVGFK